MNPKSCHAKALELLARRAHFRRELETKLRQRGYGEEEIEETLDRLTAAGYLDDSRTALEFVTGRLAREPLGPVRLRADLQRRGAGEEAIDAALAELPSDPEDQLATTRAAAQRWRRRGGRDLASLARHLQRKGFPHRAIVAVLAESAPGEEPPDLDEV